MSQPPSDPGLFDYLYQDAGRLRSLAAQLFPDPSPPGSDDSVAVRVVSKLVESGRVRTDVVAAPHGALVHVTGTLAWVDRSVLELAFVAFDAAVSQEAVNRNAKEVSMVTFLRTFLAKVPTPSAFLLRTAAGGLVAGTLKAEGMTDPISAHYFKHGTAGLADVHLVGVKEVPSQTFSLPNTQLMAAGQQAAGALGEMLFPPDALRLNPLVIYRTL